MKNIITTVLLASLVLYSTIALAEQSPWLKMTRYQVNHSDGGIVVFRRDGWQFPSCPTARVVIFELDDGVTSNLGYDATFSTIMLAYANDAPILFHGTCSTSNSDHVIGSYSITEQRL